jgi:L-threonylcarbamoyladenylate synthase
MNKLDDKTIEKAAYILKNGGIVAVPTETVYGLAADASNPKALKKLYKLKERPETQAFSLLIHSKEDIKRWAKDIPESAHKLSEAFWPGPLTMILKKADAVETMATGGKATIGLRVPDHALTQSLLQAFGSGLAVASANPRGKTPAKSTEEINAYFADSIDLILANDSQSSNAASTIVDLTLPESIKILREGDISFDTIKKTLS